MGGLVLTSTKSITMSAALKSISSIVPLLDRVLVQRVKAEAKTASGILLPEKNVEKLNQAKVLAVGPGFTDQNGNKVVPNVAPGETVLIPSFGGSPIKVGDDEVILFRDAEILQRSKSKRARPISSRHSCYCMTFAPQLLEACRRSI